MFSIPALSTTLTPIASTSNISGSSTPTSSTSSSNRSFPPAFTSISGSQRLQLLAASLNSNPSSSSRTLPPPIRSSLPPSSSLPYSISENERINTLWTTSTRIENEIIALNELLSRSREGILNLQRSAENRARELRELEEEKRRLEEGLGGLRSGGGREDGSRYPDNEDEEGQRRERRWATYEEIDDLEGEYEEEDADGNRINQDEDQEEEEPFLEEFYSDPNNLEAGIVSYRITSNLLKIKKESRTGGGSTSVRKKQDIFEKFLADGKMNVNGEIIGEWQYLYRDKESPVKKEDNIGR